MSYTKGPWEVSDNGGSVGAIAHQNGFIAFPCLPRRVDETRVEGESWLDMRSRTEFDRKNISEEQDSNARLIAAAPELLEALMDCTKWMEALRASGDAGNWDWENDHYTKAVEIIAKATGKSS